MKISDADSAHRISTLVRSAVLGVAFAFIGFLLALLLKLGALGTLFVTIGGGVGGAMLVYKFTSIISDGAGATLLAALQPSGSSTPYERQFSDAEAMAARGDFPSAIEAYRVEISRQPNNVQLKLQAAEVHVRAGAHREAEQLFVEARRISTDFSHELYATQRIIDLRLGPLVEPQRALPELRRIVDRFPNTPEARGARDAIARIKSESAKD